MLFIEVPISLRVQLLCSGTAMPISMHMNRLFLFHCNYSTIVCVGRCTEYHFSPFSRSEIFDVREVKRSSPTGIILNEHPF